MLVGNKSDIVTEREVSAQEGSALAEELGCGFIESSAKTCSNVDIAFYDLVRAIRLQREGLADRRDVNTSRSKQKKEKKCLVM